jgi:hypothetical protein
MMLLSFSPSLALIFTYSILATGISWLFSNPWWWGCLHATLPLLGAWLLSHTITPITYLMLFIVLILVFGTGSLRQAPLFLSGKPAWEVIKAQLSPNIAVLDAGCGNGGLLHYLHLHRRDLHLNGCELAWLPWLISRVRCTLASAGQQHPITIRHHDFWTLDWSLYDTIVVFLSPEPMPAVWSKFQAEMKTGSQLISYHFIVPNQPPDQHLHDSLGRSVYIWKR